MEDCKELHLVPSPLVVSTLTDDVEQDLDRVTSDLETSSRRDLFPSIGSKSITLSRTIGSNRQECHSFRGDISRL